MDNVIKVLQAECLSIHLFKEPTANPLKFACSGDGSLSDNGASSTAGTAEA